MDLNEENPNYCDMNHNGTDHEWTSVKVGGDPADQFSTERVGICKHCGVEQ